MPKQAHCQAHPHCSLSALPRQSPPAHVPPKAADVTPGAWSRPGTSKQFVQHRAHIWTTNHSPTLFISSRATCLSAGPSLRLSPACSCFPREIKCTWSSRQPESFPSLLCFGGRYSPLDDLLPALGWFKCFFFHSVPPEHAFNRQTRLCSFPAPPSSRKTCH